MKGLGFADRPTVMDGMQVRGGKPKPRKSMLTYMNSSNVAPSYQLGASPWWAERIGRQKTDYGYTNNFEY